MVQELSGIHACGASQTTGNAHKVMHELMNALSNVLRNINDYDSSLLVHVLSMLTLQVQKLDQGGKPVALPRLLCGSFLKIFINIFTCILMHLDMIYDI